MFLPWVCSKNNRRKFLKRDLCDKKRSKTRENLDEIKDYMDKDNCPGCSGPVKRKQNKEEKNNYNLKYYYDNKTDLNEKKKIRRQEPSQCTECDKDILNTKKTGLCLSCGTKKGMKTSEKKKKSTIKMVPCKVDTCNKMINPTGKTGMCLPCFNKENAQIKNEKKEVSDALTFIPTTNTQTSKEERYKKVSENQILLDFTPYPNVFKSVKEAAKHDLRDVDKQILWFLIKTNDYIKEYSREFPDDHWNIQMMSGSDLENHIIEIFKKALKVVGKDV